MTNAVAWTRCHSNEVSLVANIFLGKVKQKHNMHKVTQGRSDPCLNDHNDDNFSQPKQIKTDQAAFASKLVE